MLETTDMHITEEEVIRIYGKRWGIEVFFKVCKSYLRLEKDCRAVSGRLLSRAAVAVVTKTAKMYITNVFFQL